MRTRTMLVPLLVGLFAMVALVGGAADEQEEAVTLDQVPDPVKATILTESAGGRITEIERETRNGNVVYEAEFVRDGQEIEIRIAPDGTVLGREVERPRLTLESIPAPAREALLRLANGARIVGLERGRAHGATVYEAAWSANGTKHEAEVTEDGALLETEELVPAEQAPPGVRTAIEKHFGDAKVVVARKTIVVYEIEARVNGKEVELHVLPMGQPVEEPGDDDGGDHHDGDDGDDDDHGDDDDDADDNGGDD